MTKAKVSTTSSKTYKTKNKELQAEIEKYKHRLGELAIDYAVAKETLRKGGIVNPIAYNDVVDKLNIAIESLRFIEYKLRKERKVYEKSESEAVAYECLLACGLDPVQIAATKPDSVS